MSGLAVQAGELGVEGTNPVGPAELAIQLE